jgi:hypothetical protein
LEASYGMPETRLDPPRYHRWSLGKAFLAGALAGALAGIFWGWFDYGAFDIRFFYNHVLGGALILGVLSFLVAFIRNWSKRNPM